MQFSLWNNVNGYNITTYCIKRVWNRKLVTHLPAPVQMLSTMDLKSFWMQSRLWICFCSRKNLCEFKRVGLGGHRQFRPFLGRESLPQTRKQTNGSSHPFLPQSPISEYRDRPYNLLGKLPQHNAIPTLPPAGHTRFQWSSLNRLQERSLRQTLVRPLRCSNPLTCRAFHSVQILFTPGIP